MSELFNALLGGLGSLLSFFYDVIPSYGIAIILLTATVRLAMLPLTIKQTRSMQAMQRLSPEIKKLQGKHKGDRQKLNEEMMKLYKEHQVNPLGGCLPLILQLPVFIALYQALTGCGRFISKRVCDPRFIGVKYLPAESALRGAIAAGSAGFLGMNLANSPSEAVRNFGTIGFRVVPYVLLVLLMAVTTWYQQKQVASTQTGPQAAQMQMMGRIMPVMLAFFSLNLPAGVSVYWVASNAWTIGQQYLLLGRGSGAAVPEPAAGTNPRGSAGAAKPQAENPGGNSGPKPKGSGARKKRNRR